MVQGARLYLVTHDFLVGLPQCLLHRGGRASVSARVFDVLLVIFLLCVLTRVTYLSQSLFSRLGEVAVQPYAVTCIELHRAHAAPDREPATLR